MTFSLKYSSFARTESLIGGEWHGKGGKVFVAFAPATRGTPCSKRGALTKNATGTHVLLSHLIATRAATT